MMGFRPPREPQASRARASPAVTSPVVTTVESHAPHRWTRDEYLALADLGLELRCELIEGEIIDGSPMQVRHAYATTRLLRLLSTAAPEPLQVGSQTPIVLGDDSEPEPDMWVAHISNAVMAVRKPEPADLDLVVEVAETSYLFDRNRKLPLYARHGIPVVWIVDLRRDVVEVHSEPDGPAYRSLVTVAMGGVVGLPWGGSLDVAEFIPQR
jgi:Uma2 family endonuclease